MKLKNINKIIYLSVLGIGTLLMTGCSTENPFGVGYEHSACESSSNFGVCGAPDDVYTYKDKILRVQRNYLKSGLNTELFFGITHDGTILVKDHRTDKWQEYNSSKWKKIIEKRVYRNNEINKKGRLAKGKLNYYSSGRKISGNADLSIQYKRQGTILQTRTNVGNMIRDNGQIQRIWVAPVVDKKGDLISAHELYVVIRQPKWIVGERTPKYSAQNIHKFPTPISKDMLQRQDRVDHNQENIIQDYNLGNPGGLIHSIRNNPKQRKKTLQKNLVQINHFIQEK